MRCLSAYFQNSAGGMAGLEPGLTGLLPPRKEWLACRYFLGMAGNAGFDVGGASFADTIRVWLLMVWLLTELIVLGCRDKVDREADRALL